MSDQNLTHRELSTMVGVSETTIKSYRKKFPGCIPVASKGKPIRFTSEAGMVCTRIRDMFLLGMSVEEVRNRLAQEFTWIKASATKPKEDEKQQTAVGAPCPDAGRNLASPISNLAKSMVLLTQQQTAMLKRLSAMESMLHQAGLGKPEEHTPVEATLGPAWETRFERMQQAMEAIVDTVSQLHDMLHNDVDTFRAHNARQTVLANRTDPPRALLSLPLVFQSSRGELVNIAGKMRGRFSANDLKALLAMVFYPPDRYSHQWEQDSAGTGWWLLLTQQESTTPRDFALYIEEAATPKGDTVGLLTRLAINGEMQHPVELSQFISALQDQPRD